VAELQIRRVGETQHLFQPLLASLNWLVARIGWILGGLALVYLASGITFVRENEVALVQRFGRLVGDTPAEQIQRPGLLLALPFPIDRVQRIPVDLVRQVEIDDLDATDAMLRDDPYGQEQGDTIDPVAEGYLVTGDRALMQTRLVARYRVSDPIAWALGADEATRERLVHDSVQAAATTIFTTYGALDLFAGLRFLPTQIRDVAQARLDAVNSGIDLAEVSIGTISFPRQVKAAVEDVRTAVNVARARITQADGDRRRDLELFRRELAQILAEQRGYAREVVARVEGAIAAYDEVLPQYLLAPELVRDRMLRAGVVRILRESGARISFAPPPADGRYAELRFTLSPDRRIDAVDDAGDAEH
jgi:modulator of FtsH protease HflK